MNNNNILVAILFIAGISTILFTANIAYAQLSESSQAFSDAVQDLRDSGEFNEDADLNAPAIDEGDAAEEEETIEEPTTPPAPAPATAPIAPTIMTMVAFKLYGMHSADTVEQTLEQVGYNMTLFQPLGNLTTIVTAEPITVTITTNQQAINRLVN